ncbi:acylphosphatase-2 [Bactrocera neohumeralis]|uniref:acylphosphatase-2 n=1 Tax=Bactrocera tryoni TaxID=59916 RepID=UPI001A96D714|nr:acylphosphatase-2 [Bactrocera tryoni]XP_050336306.1 acylphosphatase-2 [Bactrocera neohumeralis]
MPEIMSCDFEVHGIVQGVSFRMYTERQARSLGVKGWCMNTPHDTVKGQIEGSPEAFEQMKVWLQKTGSPTCRIEKVDFSEPKKLPDYTFTNFSIRH